MGRSGDQWGVFSLHFRSKFFQCSVSVTLLSIFSPFLKFISHSLFVLTGQPNQYCCQATSVSRESECIKSSLAVISSRPQFSLLLSGVCFSWIVHTGSGGMEFQITLCSAASRFLSQLTSWHVCSCSVAERQSPCSGGELAFFTLDPGVAGHGVGRIPECSCPAGFTS